MKKVIVEQFGHPDVLQVKNLKTPKPGPGQVLISLTSVGMNHADLMARRGEYLISSGYPPFTPGIEGGGIIEAVGEGVKDRHVGQRVLLGANAPQRNNNPESDFLSGGTYATHYLTDANKTIPAPKALSNEQLGAIWLPYLTAWGCLVWKQRIKPGQFIGIPAASSSVALAAAQIAKKEGAIPIGLTTSAFKAKEIQKLPENAYDHLVITHDHHHRMRPWHKDLRRITGKEGVHVFFDPIAAGRYLEMEIHALGKHGTIWIYGLLGQPGPVNVTPLIRKFAAVRGWYLNELTDEGGPDLWKGYASILEGFEKGIFQQRIAKTFKLDEVVKAHQEMQNGRHIGKLILIPTEN